MTLILVLDDFITCLAKGLVWYLQIQSRLQLARVRFSNFDILHCSCRNISNVRSRNPIPDFLISKYLKENREKRSQLRNWDRLPASARAGATGFGGGVGLLDDATSK